MLWLRLDSQLIYQLNESTKFAELTSTTCSACACFCVAALRTFSCLFLFPKVKTEHETDCVFGSSSPIPNTPDQTLSAAHDEPARGDSPTTVTLTHFQESESGSIEKAVIVESSNPFLTSATSPPQAPCVRNPFVDDVQASNPFLSRLSSPIVSVRPLSPCKVNESPSSADNHQNSAVCVVRLFIRSLT